MYVTPAQALSVALQFVALFPFYLVSNEQFTIMRTKPTGNERQWDEYTLH